ncbi:helix-turn-helix domain-containing protein [Streptomyces botrytidirepellens]|uniref:Helix-turn-helix domain-containing protein n=1 Tax=Streptomyces botrytidirepellens TaxID=2486417 RepID=A0A3M8XAC6_9ACTN|nr:helix-turn-helix domain-containing protein [Streptomyces botrytidirepellens]
MPEHVWANEDVRAALGTLDLGALSRSVRQLMSLSQEDFAVLAGVGQAFVSQLESGARRVVNIKKAVDILESLGAPPGLVGLPMRGSGPRAGVSQESGHMLAAKAARDSLAFSETLTPSNVDDQTLDSLSFELSRIATTYVHAPLFPLFTDLVQVRDRIFELLKGRQRPRETRELFMLAGTSCLLLAHATQNLGDTRSAMAQVDTAWACAEQAEHTGLRAWTRGTGALIAEWSPQNRMAIKLAEHGFTLAPAGECRIRIAAIEARAAARAGNRERAREAIARMNRARDEDPEPDAITQFGGLLTFPIAKQEYYLGGVYALLGDYSLAEKHHANALQEYAAGVPEDRSYGDEALAHIDIVTAKLACDDTDGAARHLQHILKLPPKLRIRQLGTAMTRLAGTLAASKDADVRGLADLARDYQVINSENALTSL